MKIRSDIILTYQSIHTWTGIIAGLVLFIGFYAGSLSMFEDEISYWAAPSSNQLSQVPIEQYDELTVQALSTYEKAQQGFTINFRQHLSPITWYEQGGGRGLRLNDVKRHATLSEEGELITQIEPTNELGQLIDMLHRTAGIAGKVGHERLGVIVLGLAAVLYFLALVSGVIFLLPTLVKSFFALRKHRSANRFWLDSHNLVGIISLPFHIIIAWTVVVFSFHDFFYGGLSLAYGDEPMFSPRTKSQVEFSVDKLPPISAYLNKIDQLTEGYQIKKIDFSGLKSSRPMVGIEVVNSSEMMRNNSGDFIFMDPYSFKVNFSSIAIEENEYYAPLVASFFSLHFGGIGGEFGRWLYFVMGLLGAFLFYSGNLLWLEKRRKKQPIQSKSNRLMANLTIGVCLGSILAVVTTLGSSKWLYFFNLPINNIYVTIYYAIFFASLLYSFARGAATSAIHIQQAISFACLLIPFTSILAIIAPSLAIWTPTYSTDYTFDFIAIVFAGIFFYSAIKTKQRAYHGSRQSIWAL